MRTTHAVAFLCLLAGCTDQGGVVTPTSTPLQAALAPGQALIVYPERLAVTFYGVTADSRCPAGAECIREGDGAARFSVQLDRAAAAACTLHTALEPTFTESGVFFIQLVGLAPYPRIGATIDPASYVATVRISRMEVY